FVLWRLARVDPSYAPVVEGALYCVLVLVAHAIVTITACPAVKTAVTWKRDLIPGALGLAGLVGIAIILLQRREPGRLPQLESLHISVESLLGFAALLAILGAVLLYADARSIIVPSAAAAWLRGMTSIGVAILVAWGFFTFGRRIGATS